MPTLEHPGPARGGSDAVPAQPRHGRHPCQEASTTRSTSSQSHHQQHEAFRAMGLPPQSPPAAVCAGARWPTAQRGPPRLPVAISHRELYKAGWGRGVSSTTTTRFRSKLGLVEHSKLRALPVVLVSAWPCWGRGGQGPPQQQGWCTDTSLHPPTPTQGNTHPKQDTSPPQRVICLLPTHRSARAHRRWRTQENTQQKDDNRIFPSFQWPRDQSFAEEKPHLHRFLTVCVCYFSPGITTCSRLDPIPMGKCLLISARARHRFSQHNLVPMLHKCVNIVSTYSLFSFCDVLPLLPFLFLFLWLYWGQRTIYNTWQDTSLEPFRTRIINIRC